MIRSMTAYARREIKGEWGSATWEMRSVNQRYLETYFRLPEQFRSLEPVVRERIRSRLTRGKVECTLRYEPDVSAQGELILNEKLAKQLVTAANWVKMQSDEGEINPVDILRWPGVMAAQEQDLDAIAAEILAALDGTLDDFIVARETEGQALKALIEQRLIARALRAAVDLKALGEFTITLDCDVLQADGGTRTASITGACVALVDALQKLVENGKLKTNPMKGMVAAVSVGIVNGEAVCDLEYVEDSAAETDMNVVMTEDGRIIEVQGTAEGEPFTHEELLILLALARGGIESIVATQKAALAN